MRGGRSASAEHLRGLLHRDDKKTQHQVEEHLGVSAHPDRPSAVRVVEVSVDPLHA